MAVVCARSVPAGAAQVEGGEAAGAEREAALEALLAALEARDAAAERLQAARSVMAAPCVLLCRHRVAVDAAVCAKHGQLPVL